LGGGRARGAVKLGRWSSSCASEYVEELYGSGRLLVEKKPGVPAKIHTKPHVTTLGRYTDSGCKLKHYANEGGFLSMAGQLSSDRTLHLKSRRRVECGKKHLSL
jgi:hypothetical protein